MKYVFGPVHSRRLGISLGIDIIPFKVCSFNCVYCECGSTTDLTDAVRDYFLFDDIVSEISSVLDKKPELDVVTFSGSGEPTLNRRIGDIIRFIKNNYPGYKIAVLTNSSTLYLEEVRRNIIEADIIYPSLDAVSTDIFERIMRPVAGTDPDRIIKSLISLRSEFKGRICLEIFIIQGVNDSFEELAKLKDACERIAPDEIHLNQLDRPGAEDWVTASTSENMERIKIFFNPLPVKIISGKPDNINQSDYYLRHEDAVINALRGSGLSAEELSLKLDVRLFEILKVLKNLQKKGMLEKKTIINSDILFLK